MFLDCRTLKPQDIRAACVKRNSADLLDRVVASLSIGSQCSSDLVAATDIGTLHPQDIPSKLLATVVTAPFDYCASLPSKNVRSSLIDAFSIWFPVSRSANESIHSVGHLLHNASLLLDDIGDGSNLRRGQPTAHKIFGIPETVNSANFAILKAMEKVSELPAPSFALCAGEMRKLFISQGHDLLWTRQNRCPSENEYFDVIDGKTGGLFHLLIGLLMCNSKDRQAQKPARACVHRLLTALGRLFQIRDDYQNLVCPAYTNQKGFCEDLDEGKFSYPVVYAFSQTTSDVSILRNILANRRNGGCLSDELKRLALKQLLSSGSLERTREMIGELHIEVIAMIAEVEDLLQIPNWILRLLIKKLRVENIEDSP